MELQSACTAPVLLRLPDHELTLSSKTDPGPQRPPAVLQQTDDTLNQRSSTELCTPIPDLQYMNRYHLDVRYQSPSAPVEHELMSAGGNQQMELILQSESLNQCRGGELNETSLTSSHCRQEKTLNWSVKNSSVLNTAARTSTEPMSPELSPITLLEKPA